jgi:hypothetical protein
VRSYLLGASSFEALHRGYCGRALHDAEPLRAFPSMLGWRKCSYNTPDAQPSRRVFFLFEFHLASKSASVSIIPSSKNDAMFFSILFAALLLTSHAHASPDIFPRIVSQQRDTTYNGGWALGLPDEGCPADAPVSCPAGDINPTCCPFGQTCFGFEQPYCCPTGTFPISLFRAPISFRTSILPIHLSFGGNRLTKYHHRC